MRWEDSAHSIDDTANSGRPAETKFTLTRAHLLRRALRMRKDIASVDAGNANRHGSTNLQTRNRIARGRRRTLLL